MMTGGTPMSWLKWEVLCRVRSGPRDRHIPDLLTNKVPGTEESKKWVDPPVNVYSLLLKMVHRNSGFTHSKWVNCPWLCKRLPERIPKGS